jgi:hypothetical protein
MQSDAEQGQPVGGGRRFARQGPRLLQGVVHITLTIARVARVLAT